MPDTPLSYVSRSARNIIQAVWPLPFSTVLLVILMWLPSSILTPQESLDKQYIWQPAFPSVLDLVIIASLTLEYSLGLIRISPNDVLVFITGILISLFSWVSSDVSIIADLVLDVCVHWLRLFFAYAVIKTVVLKTDNETATTYWSFIGISLCISSLFVASLAYQDVPRLWASGMSVASFSGFLAVTILILFAGKQWGPVAIFSLFLLLTIGRTAILAALLALCLYAISKGGNRIRLLLVVTVILAASYATVRTLYQESDLFARGIDSAFNAESIETLDSRTSIWNFAQQLLKGDAIPWHGVGLFGTPQLLENHLFVGVDGALFTAKHFHSMILELYFGAGWLGLLILGFLVYRMSFCVASGARLSGFIYVLFFLLNITDFSLGLPKDELALGMIFGYAEGLVTSSRSRPVLPGINL